MRFIESGELDRDIKRMKKVYRNRRDILLELMKSCFGEQVHIHGAAAGMHIVAEFDGAVFSEDRIRRLLYAGVYVVPVERHAIKKGEHENQIILGYAGLERDVLLHGLQIIKDELQH
jgi:GntR family transcriptional regulator/MocR family aminotransferase